MTLRCRRWVRLALFLAVTATLILAHLGCQSEEQRYLTLRFFFDGVPVPESLQEKYGTAEGQEPVNPWDPSTQPEPVAEKRVQYLYHEPYANRDCFGCHDQQQGYTTVENSQELCQKCHRSYFDRLPGDWLHGPVIIGECAMCHEPHKSEYEGLLTGPQPRLCFRCHDLTFIQRDPFHRKLQDLTCTNCHDPHAAGNRKLLADARSYQRNDNAIKRRGSEHPQWTKAQCALCHQTGEAMLLVDDINGVCLTCHADQTVAPEQRKLHDPVAKGQCITCHTPHDSPRSHLVRPLAEALCVDCHKLEDVNTLKHPKVTRVDCTHCHSGHSATRDHLLRPGIAEPVPDEIPAGAPTFNFSEPSEDAEPDQTPVDQTPVEPADPDDPDEPVEPVDPIETLDPLKPHEPVEPLQPQTRADALTPAGSSWYRRALRASGEGVAP